MAQLYWVRHGQASFGQSNYDQLSSLGYQQATWLGEHFVEQGVVFDHILSGSLQRQMQTAENIMAAGNTAARRHVNPDFNEYPLTELRQHYAKAFPELEHLTAPTEFITKLPLALKVWSSDSDPDLPESWSGFQQRLVNGLEDIQSTCTGNVLVVSSAGAIATILSHIMGLSFDSLVHLNLNIKNTSVSQCYFDPQQCFATQVNATPHLEQPSRMTSRTFI
jgi:broad specificity phosphatase PhoE